MSQYLLGVDFDIENGQSQAEITALVARAREAATDFPKLRIRCDR